MTEAPLGRAGKGAPATIAEVAMRIDRAASVLITCHRGPDGDSVGSMIALASLLGGRGKKTTLYNRDRIPRRYEWMPLVKEFVRRLDKDARYDVTLVVDCADAKLLGKSFPGPEITGQLIALDHHSSHQPFGDFFLCDAKAASVGVLVARIARQLGWSIVGDAAIGIYVSLISDTGSFRYANTNAEAFQLAAELVAGGIDPWSIYALMGERATLSRYKLLCMALASVELTLDGKVAFMTITQSMVKEAGAAWEDTADLVDYCRALDGVECGVLFTPAKFGGVRVSMRSKGVVDCGALCEQFDGGGHRGAAGCILMADMAAARRAIERALATALGGKATTALASAEEDPGRVLR